MFFGLQTALQWIPGPIPDSVQLNPGDEIHLRFQMVDYGTWLENVNAQLIQAKLEEDPRLQFIDILRQTGIPPATPAYVPPPTPPDPSDVTTADPPPQWITFIVRVRETPTGYTPEEAQRAGLGQVAAGIVVGAVIAGGLYSWLYTHNMDYAIYRRKAAAILDDVTEDPNADTTDKVKAAEVLADMGKEPASTTAQVSQAVSLVALAFLVYFVWSAFK